MIARPALILVALLAWAMPVVAQAIRPFDADSPAAIRKEQAGKSFVLSFWSIHCAPCIEEMAVWREQAARHRDLRIVLVSTDPPGERDRVEAFLRRYPPGGVQRWQYADEFEERIRYAVDPRWRGELPRTYFFDASHRSEASTGSVSSAQVERWVARHAADP